MHRKGLQLLRVHPQHISKSMVSESDGLAYISSEVAIGSLEHGELTRLAGS
jgi:hypothetical protein